jgi:uncharacterized protein (TIGR02145 family)
MTFSGSPGNLTGNTNTNVSAVISNLNPGTTYHFRVVGTNLLGTTYGNDASFTTRAIVELSTNTITEITYNSAIGGGNITSDGEYAITARGVCWSTRTKPTINDDNTVDGAGSGSFTSEIKCLDGETTYFVRAYATNSEGTVYGDQECFTTEPSPINFNPDLTYDTVMDIDGNCYKTIQIGNQTWMAENLRTSKYNDGSPIPNVTDNTDWKNLGDIDNPQGTIGAFCWYNNDSTTYDNDYGKLYNFGAIATGKLCPIGWHVATIDEWHVLRDPYIIDFDELSGFELMESGTNHWIELSGTNEAGFTALPGGYRSQFNGSFEGLGQTGLFWTGSPFWGYGAAMYHPIPFYEDFDHTPGLASHPVTDGFSVRCIKD